MRILRECKDIFIWEGKGRERNTEVRIYMGEDKCHERWYINVPCVPISHNIYCIGFCVCVSTLQEVEQSQLGTS